MVGLLERLMEGKKEVVKLSGVGIYGLMMFFYFIILGFIVLILFDEIWCEVVVL